MIAFYKMIRYVFAIILTSILINQGYSQELTWDAGFHGFFDNREYFNKYTNDQTIFGARTFVQTGIRIDEHHEFCVGLNFLYEFGSTLNSKYIEPILYYHFDNNPVKLYIGSFERRKLTNLPLVLQSDTFQYYRPNIEGIFLEYKKPWGYQNIWLDWTSRITMDKKESFLIGGTGYFRKSVFFYRHDFIMTHYAKTEANGPHEHIRDNGGFYAGIGIDLSGIIPFDSLSLSTGFTMSYNRIRNLYPTEYYGGSLTEIYAQYKALGIHSTIYFGDGQVQMVGDALYQAQSYERFDFFWKLFRKSPVKGEVTFSLHFMDGIMNYSQSFAVYLDLGGAKKLRTFSPASDY
jgi:hypothetical protein